MNSVPEPQVALNVDEIIITSQLYTRLPRPHNAEHVRANLLRLGECLGSNPKTLLDQLVSTAVDLCLAGSAGFSLLKSTSDGDSQFVWEAMAGVYASFVGGTTPRNFSPCGVTLDRNAPQLFHYPCRFFHYFNEVSPPIVEGLVLPMHAAGRPLGTLWVVSHHEERKFDIHDVDVMSNLCYLCIAALCTRTRLRNVS